LVWKLSRILIIEDEPDVQELVKTILTGNGFEVLTASSGEEGLSAAVHNKPDLILLDWVMPGLSGLEICRLLKGREETKKTPILMMSVLNRDVDKRYVFEAGADAFLVKPFSISQLLTAVDDILRDS
jgi:DNA-binding response OmpR family regulator